MGGSVCSPCSRAAPVIQSRRARADQWLRPVAGVDGGQYTPLGPGAEEREYPSPGERPGQLPPAQGGQRPAGLPQGGVPFQQLAVLPSPGVGAAVEWVFKALQPRLVSVIDHGGARGRRRAPGPPASAGFTQGVLAGGHAEGPPASPCRAPARSPPVPSRVRMRGCRGCPGSSWPSARRRAGSSPAGSPWLPGSGRRPRQQEGHQSIAEGVVHQPVQIAPQQVLPADRVSNLVGAVLPHLPDDHRLRLGLPGRRRGGRG